MKTTIQIKSAYDVVAKDFLFTRTEGTGLLGFGHREIEQPYMFRMVPKDLQNKSLIDLGCGPGIHAREYAERGANVIGIDLSEEMINLAKEYCLEGEFEVGNAYNLRFNDASFDVVTSSLLLDHTEDLAKIVKEISRILKNKGLFIFSVPHPFISLFRSENELNIIRSYYDKKPRYFSIAGNSSKIMSYPHQITDYFQAPLREGFVLVDFLENEPSDEWLKKYDTLNQHYFMIPQLCVFKWIKN